MVYISQRHLKQEDINFFNDNGYLVINDFCKPEPCDALISRTKELIEDHEQKIRELIVFSSENNSQMLADYFHESSDKIHFFFEEKAFNEHHQLKQSFAKSINKIGHGLHVKDDVFKAFCHDPRLKMICHDLGIEQPGLVQSMYIFKQPGIGGEVLYHQDATFLHSANGDALGFWFALEDATIENGCLHVIPSDIHTPLKKKMFCHNKNTHFETFDDSPWDEEKAIPLPVKKGSLIILHGKVPHKSEANTSPKSRHAFTLHVVDISNGFPESNWLKWPDGIPCFDVKYE